MLFKWESQNVTTESTSWIFKFIETYWKIISQFSLENCIINILLQNTDLSRLCSGTRLSTEKKNSWLTIFTGGAKGEDVIVLKNPLINSY